MSNNKKTKAKYVVPLLILIFIGNLSTIFMLNLVGYQSFDKLNSYNNDLRDIHPKSQGIVQDDYTIEWLDNPTFETPITPWYNTSEGDTSDINATTDDDQANYKIQGESREKEVLLNTATQSNWVDFQRSALEIVPQRASVPYYGVDDDGAWCSHWWDEGEGGGQPKNTPRMHWRTNVSMPVDMSDYIITSLSFNATINASVDRNIDVAGDTFARFSPDININQFQTYDYAQFYVEITTLDIDELNTYKIAFNQTSLLGSEGPPTAYDIEGMIGTYGEQAIINAINNVLAVDPGHNNFTIVLGIYMYCEDNYSNTDRDYWDDLRFKFLNLTFTYQKKIDEFTSLAWNQKGDTISGANIDINNATLNFKYKIDKNWTTSSPNSEFRVYINNRAHTETVELSNANTTFQDIKIGGFDVTNLILKDVNISVSIEVYLADTFPLDQEFILSIDNASLVISYTKTTVEETTSLEIFLNSIDKTLEKSTEVTMGNPVNITIVYKNQSSNNFIPNAEVQLVGLGAPKDLTENGSLEHYNITIHSSDLQLGNNYLTITASKKYYESISESINIKVIERDTELLLFLDEIDKTLDKSIEMIYGNNGNITITYKDIEQLPKTHIDNVTVELIGIGNPQNLTENLLNNQYSIIIDTTDLGLGNSFLTVNAYKENYTTQSIRFKISVTERDTKVDVYLNGTLSSNFEFYNISIGEKLNITVFYKDLNTDSFINNANVQLIESGTSTNLTESLIFEQYFILIYTTDLGVGLNIFTIIAEKANFELFIIQKLYVKVDKIRTNITTADGVSNIVIKPGESVNLQIVINNLDFGGIVKGANVTYRWDYGVGYLTDDDNDGIYTVLLTGIPEGSFTFTITANMGEEYDFASYDIVISVIIPKEELLLFQLLAVIGGITAAALVTYLYLYQKIFKFPKPVRKVRKYSKTLRKTENPSVDIIAREKAFKVEYKTELDKTSKLLKGKPVEPIIKPEKILKKPAEGSKN